MFFRREAAARDARAAVQRAGASGASLDAAPRRSARDGDAEQRCAASDAITVLERLRARLRAHATQEPRRAAPSSPCRRRPSGGGGGRRAQSRCSRRCRAPRARRELAQTEPEALEWLSEALGGRSSTWPGGAVGAGGGHVGAPTTATASWRRASWPARALRREQCSRLGAGRRGPAPRRGGGPVRARSS